jgi:hypothetical protein
MFPDFEYIRTKVSITAVARELGLSVIGYRARCWRTENHRNGDAGPSMAFRKKQNTGRCFVCDPHTYSNIDLVMLVRGCDLRDAVSWIAARFPVPLLPKGTHIKKRESWSPRFRASDVEGGVIPMLVSSGLWRTFSHAERSILPVLCAFVDRDTGCPVPISYRGLMRYSGVGSQATIADALRHFEHMRLLQAVRAKGENSLRAVNSYRFTVDDPDFQALVMKTFQRQRDEIELEKSLRAEKRMMRRAGTVSV